MKRGTLLKSFFHIRARFSNLEVHCIPSVSNEGSVLVARRVGRALIRLLRDKWIHPGCELALGFQAPSSRFNQAKDGFGPFSLLSHFNISPYAQVALLIL